MKKLFLVLVASIAFASFAEARSFYWVSTSGGESQCIDSEADPGRYLHLSQAYGCLRPGDTMVLKGGTYVERLSGFAIPNGISSTDLTTVVAAPGEVPNFKPSQPGVILYLGGSQRWIGIDGLVFDGADVPNAEFSSAIQLDSPTSEMAFTNIEVRNTLDSGIQGGGNRHRFSNIRVLNVGQRGYAHSLYFTGRDSYFEKIDLDGSTGYCLHLYSTEGGVNNNLINEITANNCQGGAGILLGSGRGNRAYNAVVQNSDIGFLINGGETGIYNTTAYRNGMCGYIIHSTTSEVVDTACLENGDNFIFEDAEKGGRGNRLINIRYSGDSEPSVSEPPVSSVSEPPVAAVSEPPVSSISEPSVSKASLRKAKRAEAKAKRQERRANKRAQADG